MEREVLIVDHSLTVRSDLAEAFIAAGVPALVCASATEARVPLARGTVGLIVLDLMLPDVDGAEFLAELRATPQGAELPALILAAEEDAGGRFAAVPGSTEFLGQPYDRDRVVERARAILDASSSTAAQPAAKVLVIDYSPTFRGRLGEVLTDAGFDVQLAPSGEDGLRAAAADPPDIVIVDGMLPGIDGATVVRKLRLDAVLRRTPCILLTASGDRGAELRALDSGADAFIRKEENLDVLLARIAAILRGVGSHAQPRPAGEQGPKTILVVDDSPTYLDQIAAMLRGEGYEVLVAHSGEEALEIVARRQLDCILLDRAMPGLGGAETCRRIKASPASRDIPLVMVAASPDRAAMIEGLSTGADDYVLKSSDVEILKARLLAQLRRKQFEDESRRIRVEMLNKEFDAAQARAARELAESRANLLAALEGRNRDLEEAVTALSAGQREIAEKNEQLQAASRAKTEFLSTMSHELRTPLNAIIGFSEILQYDNSSTLTARQRQFVAHIHDSGTHLLELINDILDLSKIEAGKIEVTLEPVDLERTMNDALAIVRETALSKSIALESRALSGVPFLMLDRRRLRQILYNLLTNALKFTPRGGRVTLEAAVVTREHAASAKPGFADGMRMPLAPPSSGTGEGDRFIQVSVWDTGVGIAPEDATRLFTPFTQINSSLTRRLEGTGLGLVTVLQLVRLHGGTVAVTSEPGRGSCFTFWLPWRESVVPIRPVARTRTEPARPLALVVEDNEHASTLMRLQLEAEGLEVRRVDSAEAALQLAGECTPDLITLDILLPGADGWELLARIKQIPAWANVPVVVVSAVADLGIGFSLGAAAVLEKPMSREDLTCELLRLGLKPSASKDVTVLVIDDDPRAVDLIGAYLSEPGYNVLRAYGGREGIGMAQSYMPDLVVLDLLMPDVGGIEVVKALGGAPATARIPVIMVTSSRLSQEERAEVNGHVRSVIRKSDFRRDGFISEVRRALGPTVGAT
jgi:DNA-binding response OmpR family regulator